MKKLLFLTLAVFITANAIAQEPARKALIGAYADFSKQTMVIDSIANGSTLQKAGLQKGDVITAINNHKIASAGDYYSATGDIRSGDEVSIAYERSGKSKTKKIKAVMRPYETSEIADVYYDWVVYGKCKLRAITRKPKNVTKAPAVLLVPGYNCGSVENYMSGIYKNLITEWLNNGYVVVTVEKSGLGDSYGCTPCLQADLATDIQTFDAGYKYMEQLPYVDKNNLFIWGHSMGGLIAPEIAQHHSPRGVIAFATVFRPWAEFLPEMHRVQFPLDGHSFEKTEQDVRMIHKIYDEFFADKKNMDELYETPEYRDLLLREFGYKKGNENLWGRHYRFWQQIDSLDMAAAWSHVNCPVLSVFGGADFIACSELEHQLITRTVNSTHPGNATHITIPDVDHLILKNKDWKEAYSTFNNRSTWESKSHKEFPVIITRWMNQQLAKP